MLACLLASIQPRASPVAVHVDLTLAARYVRLLGLDPVTDADMLWVAEEAFHSPLPPHYTEEYDASGRPATKDTSE